MSRAAVLHPAWKWTAIVIGAVGVILLLVLVILQWNADVLRAPLGRLLSARLERRVALDGRLEMHLLQAHPRILVRQLHIGNPAWAGPGDAVRVGQLELQLAYLPLLGGRVVLPYLGMEDTEVHLRRDAQDRTNWRFGSPNGTQRKSGAPLKLPILRSLHLGAGRLTVQDEIRHLHFDGTVSAAQGDGGRQTLNLGGSGDINGAPFQMNADGDPLLQAETGQPYTFNAAVRAGATRAKARVLITKPFDLGSLALEVQASGDDFADLYYLTGLALPNSAPYEVSGYLQREGMLLKLTRFEGTLGHSDLHGEATVDLRDTRPRVQAALYTDKLIFADLGPTLGAQQSQHPSSLSRGARATDDAAPRPSARRRAAHHTLLPTAQLDLERVRGMDAVVSYKANSVEAPKLTMREIDLQLQLERGVLQFEPLSFTLPQGRVVSSVWIDATRNVPVVHLGARMSAVDLGQFRPRNATAAPFEGTLVGRAQLEGRGRSVHEVAATARGRLSLVVPHGEIRRAFAELTGINLTRGLGLLLTKSEEQTNVRCGVANFKAQGGVFAVESMVVDTDEVLITGKGEIDLGDEIVDLSLNGQPKQWRLVRVRSPIEISGTLAKPHAGLKPGNALTQAGAAAVLGALLTPVAGVLAFVDPGLAKDADCGALLAEARSHGAVVPQREAAAAAPDARR